MSGTTKAVVNPDTNAYATPTRPNRGNPDEKRRGGERGIASGKDGTDEQCDPAGEQRERRESDRDPEAEQAEPLPPPPAPVASERHLAGAERLDQHELHDRSDQRDHGEEQESHGDDRDDERQQVDRKVGGYLIGRDVSRRCRRAELCRREAYATPDEERDDRELQPAAHGEGSQELPGDAERSLYVFDCVGGEGVN
ncbi:hypothetical protein C463_10175 [Halorubrum californiense DSM 19288]|uniref:Uncharacterized protein n=1 Tax=Halorubrum californiense DSM 19288 TaxID=1227465 RepID=M0E7I2_9EURY|nr:MULTISPECIES: hypothetical protein [Halorubrum]ELZ42963.1 hypothetical protein C463_10175 [Halorubrum californiense DSM 19288]